MGEETTDAAAEGAELCGLGYLSLLYPETADSYGVSISALHAMCLSIALKLGKVMVARSVFHPREGCLPVQIGIAAPSLARQACAQSFLNFSPPVSKGMGD